MAICDFCGQEMAAVSGCVKVDVVIDFFDGQLTLPPIPYGQEQERIGFSLRDPRCHDCGCLVGSFHHPGCDVEECPLCHEQLIGCGHGN